MTEERKHAILFAATILLARKLMPTLEKETSDGQIKHYQWRGINQASRILDKIDERWPGEEMAEVAEIIEEPKRWKCLNPNVVGRELLYARFN